MESQTQRRRKFVRNGAAPPLVLTPRDLGILRDVSEYRFLNTEQLLSLHEGSRRNLTERLSRLYQHGYLDRPEIQKAARLSSSHLFYSLGRKGAAALAEDAAGREEFLRQIREIQKSLPLIAHAAMIAQFRVCLTLALKNRPDVKLVRWLQGSDLKAALASGGKNPELVPDAFFILEDSHKEFPKLSFFLEADRGTMREARFVKKLQTYWQWRGNKRCEASLGITRFRVLTITENDRHSENLRRAAKDADDRKQGSLMYLFAPETRYDVRQPEAIFETIWKSPKDGDPHSIIE